MIKYKMPRGVEWSSMTREEHDARAYEECEKISRSYGYKGELSATGQIPIHEARTLRNLEVAGHPDTDETARQWATAVETRSDKSEHEGGYYFTELGFISVDAYHEARRIMPQDTGEVLAQFDDYLAQMLRRLPDDKKVVAAVLDVFFTRLERSHLAPNNRVAEIRDANTSITHDFLFPEIEVDSFKKHVKRAMGMPLP